ncbi:hypothetical protein TWF281_004615 [Arthrobotrys megalospora]
MKAFIPIAVLLPFVIAQTVPLSECTIDRQNGIPAYYFSYTEQNNDLKRISASYTQGVGVVTDQTSGFGSGHACLKVYIGSDEVFSQNLTVDSRGRAIRKTMHWGPFFGGPRKAIVDSVGNIMTNGIIDGRAFVVNKNITMTFLDGRDPPLFKFPRRLRPTLSAFAQRMAKELKLCTASSDTNASVSTAIEPVHVSPLMGRQAGQMQDRGHFSNTRGDATCILCKALWVAWWAEAEVACSLATCWWSFGIGCAACAAATAGHFQNPVAFGTNRASTVRVVVAPPIWNPVSVRRAAQRTRFASGREVRPAHAVLGLCALTVAAHVNGTRNVPQGGAALTRLCVMTGSVVLAQAIGVSGASAAPMGTGAATNAAPRVTQTSLNLVGYTIVPMLPATSAVNWVRSRWALRESAVRGARYSSMVSVAPLVVYSVLASAAAAYVSPLGDRQPNTDSIVDVEKADCLAESLVSMNATSDDDAGDSGIEEERTVKIRVIYFLVQLLICRQLILRRESESPVSTPNSGITREVTRMKALKTIAMIVAPEIVTGAGAPLLNWLRIPASRKVFQERTNYMVKMRAARERWTSETRTIMAMTINGLPQLKGRGAAI